jgi:hypothetical protein
MRQPPDQGRGRPGLQDLAVIHDRDPLAERLGLVHVVSREHHGVTLGRDRPQQVPEVPAGLWVQCPGRLVQEQHIGPVHQGAGDGEPLCLPAGELLGPGRGHVGQAHDFEHFVSAPGGDSIQVGEGAQLPPAGRRKTSGGSVRKWPPSRPEP